jgi:hypothetical protein
MTQRPKLKAGSLRVGSNAETIDADRTARFPATGLLGRLTLFYESEDFPAGILKIENIQSFVKPKIKDVQVP